MPGWEDAPLVEQPEQTKDHPSWMDAPEVGYKAKALAYGEIVGEHHHAAQYGPQGNKLQPFDVALSPNIEEAAGLNLGDWVDVKLDGSSIGKRRFADRSFRTEGVPTHNAVELRDVNISGEHVTVTPTPAPSSWDEAPIVDVAGHVPSEEAAPIELPTPAPTPEETPPPAEEEASLKAEEEPVDEGRAKGGYPTLAATPEPAAIPTPPTPEDLELPSVSGEPEQPVVQAYGNVPQIALPEIAGGLVSGLGETAKGLIPTSPEAIRQLGVTMAGPSAELKPLFQTEFVHNVLQTALSDYDLVKQARAKGIASKETGRAIGILLPQVAMGVLGYRAPFARVGPIQRLSSKEIAKVPAFAGKVNVPKPQGIELYSGQAKGAPRSNWMTTDINVARKYAGEGGQINVYNETQFPVPLKDMLEDRPEAPQGTHSFYRLSDIEPIRTEPISKFSNDTSDNALPKLDSSDGSVKPPPPGSIYGTSDIPPNQDPAVIHALRAGNKFQQWWQDWWPRTRKLVKVAPDSPAVTAHQRLLSDVQRYIQNYTGERWWKQLREHTDEELIDLEHRAVKAYDRALQRQLSLQGGAVDRAAARAEALAGLPDWFQQVLAHREARIPIEQAAAEILGVDPPKYLGEPYIARLTTQEGKNVFEIKGKKGQGATGNLRTTLGSYDKSRTFSTMKEGIGAGVEYEPVRRAMLLRELTSAKLEATANFVKSLRDGGVIYEDPRAALANSPTGKIAKVQGLAGQDYYARTVEEGKFIEHSVSMAPTSPYGKLHQILNTYVRNPSLVNPLPHVTKNMFFKYILSGGNPARLLADVVEFSKGSKPALMERFNKVMPMTEGGDRVPQIIAKESGTFAQKALAKGFRLNEFSSNFIFNKADPAMRYSLWKSYLRKGFSDQEAANNVWIDLVRYDENSGGINVWKSVPFNFFVPWRLGTYVTLAKQALEHPVRTLAVVGSLEYLREMRYRKSGMWTHLPSDYIDAPLAEVVLQGTKIHDVRSAKAAAESVAGVAASLAIFGPGGGQAPTTIRDVMSFVQGDPKNKERILNMFWGLSQIYNMPREFAAYQKDGDTNHLLNILTSATVSEHAALKYEPRRLMKWLPEWMPGMQKSLVVKNAEKLRDLVEKKAEKSQATFESRHGVTATFQYTPEQEQMIELRRAAGARGGATRPAKLPQPPRPPKQPTLVRQQY